MSKENPDRDAVPGDRRPASDDSLKTLAFKTAAYALVFALWLCASAILIRAGYRNTPAFTQADPEMHVKLASYDALEAPPDVVFLGTSRVYRHVNITLLENALAEVGCSNVSAYNFGLSGASVSNMRFILDWMLARKARPALIIVEQNGAVIHNLISSNKSYLYTPYFRPRMWVLTYGKNNVAPFAEIMLNKGAFHRLIEAKKGTLIDPLLAGEHGYRTIEEEFSPDSPSRVAYAELLISHPEFLAEKFEPSKYGGGRATTTQARSAILFHSIHRRDLTRIAVINAPPSRFAVIAPDVIKVGGVEMPVFNAKPDDLPWLTNADYWIDEGHLNAAGAEKFSAYLAPGICQELRRRDVVHLSAISPLFYYCLCCLLDIEKRPPADRLSNCGELCFLRRLGFPVSRTDRFCDTRNFCSRQSHPQGQYRRRRQSYHDVERALPVGRPWRF